MLPGSKLNNHLTQWLYSFPVQQYIQCPGPSLHESHEHRVQDDRQNQNQDHHENH